MNEFSEKNQKTLKIVLLIILSLIFIEVSLRVAGLIYVNNLFYNSEKQNIEKNSSKILALGESSTMGLWVEKNESYPAQLEKKLQEYYSEKNIKVIVPIHLGQNTGQMANRINKYIESYNPKVIIIMAGYNNELQLYESHITKFIKGPESLRVNLLIFLDKLRIYRVVRYIVIRLRNGLDVGIDYLFDGPEYQRFPPKGWVHSFAIEHRKEFIQLWKYDLSTIIDAAKKKDIDVILMTYHINPSYLSIEDFENLSKEKNVDLVRNDLSFEPFISNENISNYVFETDNWHPNYLGYSIIAENAFKQIIKKKLIN